MAIKSPKQKEKNQPKTVATMIREAIDKNGYKDVKECARSIKVPYDLFNKVVGGHIPKDSQLAEYAKKLNINSKELILTAYRERAPDDMKRYFNSVLLLENHNVHVRGILDLIDEFNSDQLEEMHHIASIIQHSSRENCRKAISFLALYQQMDSELIHYFDSLILFSLRNDNLPGMKEYKQAVDIQKTTRPGRKGRLRA